MKTISYLQKNTQPNKLAKYQNKRQNKQRQRYLANICLALLSVMSVATVTLVTGCGFHLRGYDAPMNMEVKHVAIKLDDSRNAFTLKQPLIQQLESVGINVVDDIEKQIHQSHHLNIASITVSNIRFKRYELVGVVTEIRLLLAADVTYQTLQGGKPIQVSNPIEVERSYQFNKASVSVEDQQGEQIRDWLYDTLAQRITNQYVALSLPRVAPTAQTP
ncbi:hypothetical protein [Psychrobacter sp. I-STPA6b]|uniref:LPS-assembly lipoprotein LptE n=1 Tax=Psychrobacter sp. I-STPA6b TaxID=2585718 RepID=UPI001D0CBE02|nr:hypothetical protein [Psychrobacter sp. I-STPA6b]